MLSYNPDDFIVSSLIFYLLFMAHRGKIAGLYNKGTSLPGHITGIFFIQDSEILKWIWDHVKVDRLLERNENSMVNNKHFNEINSLIDNL